MDTRSVFWKQFNCYYNGRNIRIQLQKNQLDFSLGDDEQLNDANSLEHINIFSLDGIAQQSFKKLFFCCAFVCVFYFVFLFSSQSPNHIKIIFVPSHSNRIQHKHTASSWQQLLLDARWICQHCHQYFHFFFCFFFSLNIICFARLSSQA